MLQKTAAVLALVVLGAALATLLQPAGAARAGSPLMAGRYRVVAGESAFVLHDSITGVCWLLPAKPGESGRAWLPIRRINTEAEAQRLRAAERERERN